MERAHRGGEALAWGWKALRESIPAGHQPGIDGKILDAITRNRPPV